MTAVRQMTRSRLLSQLQLRKVPALPVPKEYSGEDTDLTPENLDRWDAGVRLKNLDPGKTTIDILGVMGPGMFEEGITARSIQNQLRGARDVVVNINSPGGSAMEGIAIYNVLRAHDGQIEVNILGLAASVASVVAMAGDTIRIARTGFMMVHNSHGIVIGNRHDLADMIVVMEQLDKAIANVYAVRSGSSEAEMAELMDKETTMDGETAIDKGLADEFLSADQVGEDLEARLRSASVSNLRRMDTIMARAGVPRSERRSMLKDLRNKPSAVADKGMSSAALSSMSAMLASIEIPVFSLK